MLDQTLDNSVLLPNEALAQFIKASADKYRVDILKALSKDSYSVQELCHIVDLKQSAMSHHLKVLAAADMVTTRREGNTLYYRRQLLAQDHAFAELQTALFNSMDKSQLSQPSLDGIRAIEQHRIESSKIFFVDNADKFREQQDLIASFEQYGESVSDVLHTMALSSKQLAIEIGPGEGLFLPVLSKQFDHVYGYDSSAVMLEQSKQHSDKHQLPNVELILGDTRTAVDNANTDQHYADCIIINMVLHHVATPADLFTNAGQLLKKGGALIVTDLCHHDQSWAKEACGDVWLGFEPEDLSLWAKRAELAEGQSTYLAQRNGFRIQIRHFYKP